jgi:hypothetical protein
MVISDDSIVIRVGAALPTLGGRTISHSARFYVRQQLIVDLRNRRAYRGRF